MSDAEQVQASAANNDPGELVFEIDTSLEFSKRGSGQQTHYVVHDPRLGSYFRLGVAEYHVVTLLDGQRTLREVFEQLFRDGVAWSLQDVVLFVKELSKHRISRIAASQRESLSDDAEPPQPSSPKPFWQRLVRVASSTLSQRIPLADGQRVANRLTPLFGFLFSSRATILATLFICSGIAVVWNASDSFTDEIRRVFDQPIWVFAAIWFLLKLVHECGHAVCARNHGVRVGPMGVMFFLFAPLAYVDVTDAWKLARRRDRVQIALAGVYLELIIGAAAAWVWWLSPIGPVKHFAAQVFLVAGPATLLVNANPLLRLDGYYVLSDLLEIPNLRQHARERLVRLVETQIFALPTQRSGSLRGWRDDFALFHGVCSVLFQIVWMSGLIVAVGKWAKGLGAVLAVIAILVWCIIPGIRWMHKAWTFHPQQGWVLNVSQRRLLVFCAFAALMVKYVTIHSSPFARRVPVVVRFQNEQIARAPVDAFVKTVLVECGQRVKKGRLLAVLSQPDLVVQQQRLIDQQDLEDSKAIQFRRRGELAMAAASSENSASLGRRIAELSEQLAGLRIVAKRDGIVSSPVTEQLLGRWVHAGDEIVRVSDPQEKELLAVVSESDVESYRNAVEENAVATVRLRGGISLDTVLRPLKPSASQALPHPALAATSGGPLPIEPDPDGSEPRLVQPQLQTTVALDAFRSLKVRSGQVGRLTIPDSRSLASRVWESLNPMVR
ncbi:MAG: site-2 protease family protein [Planctomycetota bacterium]